ncbi:unnamed protein product [Acanthosepion pharaonis]|uniref:Uncharacterized protein n=1 Tax=Acanthosepion pharaonis TaxID=158019 RepID=A0A812EUD3_ACAPH|nr:unnamed protein product [Sepia pharaonis]
MYRRQIKLLKTFHNCRLQLILHVTWKDKVAHSEVLQCAEVVSIRAIIKQRFLRWAGHMRMSGSRLPKIVFFGEIETGSRPRAGPKKQLRDYLKRALVSCNIDPTQLESLERDWIGWRFLCVAGVANFEKERLTTLEVKQHQRHHQPANSASGMFSCHLCPRASRSRIVLNSHLAAHRRRTETKGQ